MAIKGGLGLHQVGVTLIVTDVCGAAHFYKEVFGAEEPRGAAPPSGGRLADSTITSVELRLKDIHLTVAEENPNWRKAPRPDWPRAVASSGGTSVAFTLYVDDVDATFAKAKAMGASSQLNDATPQNVYWGDRVIQIHDPFGHVWRIQSRLEDVDFEELPRRFEAERAAAQRGDSGHRGQSPAV